jgi:hypothetical protein
MATNDRVLDVSLELDLGDISGGPSIILKGLERDAGGESVFHYDFEPLFAFPTRSGDNVADAPGEAHWSIDTVDDDLGTDYLCRGGGGWGPEDDGLVRHGVLSIGSVVPRGASKLTIHLFRGPGGSSAPDWVSEFTLDLGTGELSGVKRSGAESIADWAAPSIRIPFVYPHGAATD